MTRVWAGSSSGSGGLCARVKREAAREALALMPKPAVVEASAMGSATLIVKATRSGRREVRANRRRCSVEGLGSRCVLRALWVSVVRCVSESMGCMAPANLGSFSLHKQKGRGVRAGRAERAERAERRLG